MFQNFNFISLFLDYLCHVYVGNDGLSGVAITDKEYNQRVAFNMLNKVLNNYLFMVE